MTCTHTTTCKITGSDERYCTRCQAVLPAPRGSVELQGALDALMKPTTGVSAGKKPTTPEIVPPRPFTPSCAVKTASTPIVAGGWITLPYPVGINRMYRNVPNVGRVLTNDAIQWKGEAQSILQAYGGQYTMQPVKVSIKLFRKRRAGDIDGGLKIILDALKGTVIRDDEQVVSLFVERFEDSVRPRCEVLVQERK